MKTDLDRNHSSNKGIFCRSVSGPAASGIYMALDMSQYTGPDPHLSSGERVLSVLAGLGLTSIAAQPRPNIFLSMLALGTGSYLAYRGATGYCLIKASFQDQAQHGATTAAT